MRYESAHEDNAGTQSGHVPPSDLTACVRHLAHELRNTLSATTGWVHVLSHAAGPAEIAKAVEAIERNLKLHGALTEDLVDAAAVAAGGSFSPKTLTEVAAVLDHAQSDVAVLAQRRDVRVERSQPDSTLRVQVESDRLRRMVATLLRGAVEVAPRTSRVRVRVASLDANVELRIEGSSQAASAVDMPTGTRLVAILAQMHGGSLAAFGDDGGGAPTAFALCLPRR